MGELTRPEGLHRFLEGQPPEPCVGLTLGWVIADEAELLRIAVHPRMRRRGLGSRLLHDFTTQAYKRGARSCFLEVRADNQAAIALYSAHHFENVSHRTAYYPDGCDAVLMRLSMTQ
jgi:ribosomal-protein-alanine N-acetyltransferase